MGRKATSPFYSFHFNATTHVPLLLFFPLKLTNHSVLCLFFGETREWLDFILMIQTWIFL